MSIGETASENQRKWDIRFLEMAELVAGWSKDPSTKCGAVIVRPDRSIVSVGYNGFPRGIPDLQEHLDNRCEKYQRVVHAEMNAILNAQGPVHGFTLYSVPASFTGGTCDRCAVHVIQAGITRIVHYYTPVNTFNDRWKEPLERAQEMYDAAGVEAVGIPV